MYNNSIMIKNIKPQPPSLRPAVMACRLCNREMSFRDWRGFNRENAIRRNYPCPSKDCKGTIFGYRVDKYH